MNLTKEQEINHLRDSNAELLNFLKFLVYDGHLKSTCENIKDAENCLKCMAQELIAKAEGRK